MSGAMIDVGRWTPDGDMISAPTGNIADCCDADTASFIVLACKSYGPLLAALKRLTEDDAGEDDMDHAKSIIAKLEQAATQPIDTIT